jgi:hypothetical protein
MMVPSRTRAGGPWLARYASLTFKRNPAQPTHSTHTKELVMTLHIPRVLLLAAAAVFASSGAQAQEKFTFLTNWYAQAEHGGFYQALASGLYKKEGLDVTIKMGGPQVNGMQLLAAGQANRASMR